MMRLSDDRYPTFVCVCIGDIWEKQKTDAYHYVFVVVLCGSLSPTYTHTLGAFQHEG